MPNHYMNRLLKAAMTLVVAMVACACSNVGGDFGDNNDDYYQSANSLSIDGVYSMRWISNKKTVAETEATVVFNSEKGIWMMKGWTLPEVYVLSKVMSGQDYLEAREYVESHPTILNAFLSLVGYNQTSYFYNIWPDVDNNILSFDVVYHGESHLCNLYLNSYNSAIAFDLRNNEISGVLNVDSVEVTGKGNKRLVSRDTFSLTASGKYKGEK